MAWVKTYKDFMNESETVTKEVEELEKLLKLPLKSGVFKSVTFDKVKKQLVIEQPTDLAPLDAGAVLAAINKEKPGIKKAYSGVQAIVIGDLQIRI
jgi:hypothetical protein